MFDVGFSELCMVALVALLVIGPEKLPKVARIAGFWVGKARHMVATVKAEVRAELQAEEMRQLLEEQNQIGDLKQLIDEGNAVVNDLKSVTEQVTRPDLTKNDN